MLVPRRPRSSHRCRPSGSGPGPARCGPGPPWPGPGPISGHGRRTRMGGLPTRRRPLPPRGPVAIGAAEDVIRCAVVGRAWSSRAGRGYCSPTTGIALSPSRPDRRARRTCRREGPGRSPARRTSRRPRTRTTTSTRREPAVRKTAPQPAATRAEASTRSFTRLTVRRRSGHGRRARRPRNGLTIRRTTRPERHAPRTTVGSGSDRLHPQPTRAATADRRRGDLRRRAPAARSRSPRATPGGSSTGWSPARRRSARRPSPG